MPVTDKESGSYALQENAQIKEGVKITSDVI
jgi:hypothetical protein